MKDPNALIQSNNQSIFYQPDPYNPDGYLLPWHLDTLTTSSQAIPSTSHAWTYQHESLNITVGSNPGAPTTALNDNWVPTHLISDGKNNYFYTMGYYERQDTPFHFALAETLTLCDAYHCSVLGPTWPNRMVSAITTNSATEESFTNVYGVAATPDGTEVWVTDSGTNVVSVIGTASNEIASSVVVGVYAHGWRSRRTARRPT